MVEVNNTKQVIKCEMWFSKDYWNNSPKTMKELLHKFFLGLKEDYDYQNEVDKKNYGEIIQCSEPATRVIYNSDSDVWPLARTCRRCFRKYKELARFWLDDQIFPTLKSKALNMDCYDL